MNKKTIKFKLLIFLGIVTAFLVTYCISGLKPSTPSFKKSSGGDNQLSAGLDDAENHKNQESDTYPKQDVTEKSVSVSQHNTQQLDVRDHKIEPSNVGVDFPEVEFPSLVKNPDGFIKTFLTYLLKSNPSPSDVMTILKKSGGNAQSTTAGNEDTGRRLEVTLGNEKELGFSKFKLVYQLSEQESFERFIFGRAPSSDKWNIEYNRMKNLIHEEYRNSAISISQRSEFVTWRLSNQRIIWINQNHQAYGTRMILVGLEYDIH